MGVSAVDGGGQEGLVASPPPRAFRAPAFALGASLARRGVLVALAIVIAVVTALFLGALAFVLARRGETAPVASVPVLASSALAWGGVFLQAVAVAAGALRRDGEQGLRQLLVARTTSLRGYLVGRVGGLAIVLAVVGAGGTLFVSAVALLVAPARSAPAIAQATVASTLYAIAFAAVMSPVVFAALGARTRLGGYLGLLVALVVPELVVTALGSAVPQEIAELCAIPSALAALRSSLLPGGVDPARLARALVALGVFAAIAGLVLRREAATLEGAVS